MIPYDLACANRFRGVEKLGEHTAREEHRMASPPAMDGQNDGVGIFFEARDEVVHDGKIHVSLEPGMGMELDADKIESEELVTF